MTVGAAMNRLDRFNSFAAVAIVALCAAWATPAAAQSSGQPGPVTGDAARGKQLYYEHTCYGCHGYNGQTGVRRLVDSPLLTSEQTFITYLRLRADQAPVLPSTRMPNFPESSLSDADAKDIYAYIRTFRLDAPDVDDVPALRAIVESASESD
jgi:mono/diheme cytochrome c family protein